MLAIRFQPSIVCTTIFILALVTTWKQQHGKIKHLATLIWVKWTLEERWRSQEPAEFVESFVKSTETMVMILIIVLILKRIWDPEFTVGNECKQWIDFPIGQDCVNECDLQRLYTFPLFPHCSDTEGCPGRDICALPKAPTQQKYLRPQTAKIEILSEWTLKRKIWTRETNNGNFTERKSQWSPRTEFHHFSKLCYGMCSTDESAPPKDGLPMTLWLGFHWMNCGTSSV